MPSISRAQEAIFVVLADHRSITCSMAIHAGANGRTLSAMVDKGWLVKRHFPNGPQEWELTSSGIEIARDIRLKP